MSELLLSNVPYDCDESDLREWMESHGYPVVSVRLVCDKVSGVSPSFAYVELRENAKNSDAALRLSGRILKGRALKVEAVPDQAQGRVPA